MSRSNAKCRLLAALTILTTFSANAGEMDDVVFAPPVWDEPAQDADMLSEERVTGFVEARAGYGKSADFDVDGTRWALRGTVNGATLTNWNVQVDADYERTLIEGLSVDNLTGSAHAYYREPGAYAVGGFAQASKIGSNIFDALVPLGADSHATDMMAGAEAAAYFDSVTLFGQAGVGQVTYTGVNIGHQAGRIGARLYANDNTRLDLEFGAHRLSAFGASANIYSASATGNYRFASAPVTAFAGYRFDRGTASFGSTSLGSTDAHNILAGVRYSFGSSSLKDEERNGPAWSPMPLDL